ncbi:MAG: RluA family pseudouridine synthase [Candidatus Uhrbacteria bacterium]|nr:RluA family pseudouridine synthase [Candidatus Uhrbacteria bacterium]
MKSLKQTNLAPERIDKVIAEALGFSRTKIQKAIKSGLILVDGKTAKPHSVVTAENTISYDPTILDAKAKSTEPVQDLEIIYEDDDLIVINKPAGLLVHETETSTETTLTDALIKHFPEIANIGDDPKRPGLVHRLDKAVSGVMVIAKNQKAFEFLKTQFKDRKATKIYTALVHGVINDETGTIDLPISRSKTRGGRMAARPKSQVGKDAVTHFEVLERFDHFTLLNVRIETGRTNQIRVHLFALGYPVVGDRVYKQKAQKLANLSRVFLHARELTIELPNGEEKTFKADLPEKLKSFLENIK